MPPLHINYPIQIIWKSAHAVAKYMWQRDSLYVPLIIFLVFRILTAFIVIILLDGQVVQPPQWIYWNVGSATCEKPIISQQPGGYLVNGWCRFDTAWYLKNAMEGYHEGNPGIVFPPLYPVLIHLVASVTNNYLLSCLLISNFACYASFAQLYQLIKMEYADRHLAYRAVIGLAAFPTAFYLLAGYSEALYLALALAAFLAALKRRWWLAGVCALLASLDRGQGLVLCLPLGWLAYVHFRETGFKAIMVRAPVFIGPIVGVVGYWLYLWLFHLGSLAAAYASEWRIYTRPPWVAIQSYLVHLLSGQALRYENENALVLVVLVMLSIVVTVKLKPAYALYVWGTLLVTLLRYHDGPQFEGSFRYALTFFPCFIVGGMLLRRWWLILPYATGSIY